MLGPFCSLTISEAENIIRIKHVEGGGLQKKLTITVDERVYDGLYKVVGHRRISRFIEDLVKPYIVSEDLNNSYKCMAEDEVHEAEALEWSEAAIVDMSNEKR